MTERTGEHPNTERANTDANAGEANTRTRWLGRARTAFLTAVVALPPVLNAQNIVSWAHSPNGLGLGHPWDWTSFAGLDLIAAVCVIETLIQTERGKRAGAFAFLVWAFAAASAYAGYRHGTQPHVGRDVKWFFPFLALAGPVLLHLVLKQRRLDKQVGDGRRITHAPASAYGWGRWVPCVGAFTETYCAWRVGRLEGVVRPADAVARYRDLRPNAGRFGLRVLHAMRVEVEQSRARRTVRPNAAQQTKANGTPIEPVAEPKPPTEQTIAPDAKVRSIESARRHTNTAKANGAPETRAQKIQRIKDARSDWRTNMPSVRDVAEILGVSTSTAHGYYTELAREANTPAPKSERSADGDDAEERVS